MKEYEIILKDLLCEKALEIPDYQRSYEWNKKNVIVLLEDILEGFKHNKEKRLNIGTIILLKEKNRDYIVDGLQRIITFSLILKSLDDSINIDILDKELLCTSDFESIIINNYNTIDSFKNRIEKIEKIDLNEFKEYIKNKIYFYLINTQSKEEAFQLFSGRNSKYKELTPVDLLKAYHLGEMVNSSSDEELKEVLAFWDKNINDTFKIKLEEEVIKICPDKNKIDYLYDNIIFNIYNWSLNKYTTTFTENDKYLYEGYNNSIKYPYVKYYSTLDNNYFQLNKPFKAGYGFFKMTEHYIRELDRIIENYNWLKVTGIGDLYLKYKYSFKYIDILYYSALLMYFDKFSDKKKNLYDEMIKDYILQWVLTLRVKKESIGEKQVNNYVVNNNNNFFFECNKALDISKLLLLNIENKGKNPKEARILGELRGELWNLLK